MIPNEQSFWRAHEQYYALPEEDDFTTCQVCIDGLINNPDFDPDEADPDLIESEMIKCGACDGDGIVNVSGLDRSMMRYSYICGEED